MRPTGSGSRKAANRSIWYGNSRGQQNNSSRVCGNGSRAQGAGRISVSVIGHLPTATASYAGACHRAALRADPLGQPAHYVRTDQLTTTVGARFLDRKLTVAVHWQAVAAKPLSEILISNGEPMLPPTGRVQSGEPICRIRIQPGCDGGLLDREPARQFSVAMRNYRHSPAQQRRTPCSSP